MATVTPDLVFSQTPARNLPAELVFGAADFVVPNVTVNAALDLGGVAVFAYVDAPVNVHAAITLGTVSVNAFLSRPTHIDVAFSVGGVSLSAACVYDNRVVPWKDARILAPLGAGVYQTPCVHSQWSLSRPQRGGKEEHWQRADGLRNEPVARFANSLPSRAGHGSRWQCGTKTHTPKTVGHQRGLFNEGGRQDRYQLAEHRETSSGWPLQTGIFHHNRYRLEWQGACASVLDLLAIAGASRVRAGRLGFNAPWQRAGRPLSGVHVIVVPPVGPPTFWWGADLLFDLPAPATPYLLFGDCSKKLAVVVPIRSVYIVLNDASLRRVDGNIELPTHTMALALDVDSWTWSFSATLPGRALADLEPSSSGSPVEVEASINGTVFCALVESIERSREFGVSDLRISGRGKTAMLDAPYAPALNFTNAQTRTAQQLMNDVLTLNGVSLGWQVQWGLTDWSVPSGVFSHQGSYIGALNKIAGAAGGYVQPHASSQIIRVLPRYPIPPWQWGTVVPDFELPVQATSRESLRWSEKPACNRVFVSGQEAGVLAQVTRSGTAGDVLATMVVDALITEAAAARQRGIAVLSDTGRQIEMSLRLPVLGETGIILPGSFVDYQDGSVSRRGLVRSTQVQAGLPEVWQTLGVQTYA